MSFCLGKKSKTHQAKQHATQTSWQAAIDALYDSHIQRSAPLTHVCSNPECKSECENIIHCPDCGPGAYFCPGCVNDAHRFVIFHHPKMWTVRIIFK